MVKGVVTKNCKKVDVDGVTITSNDPNTIGVETIGGELTAKNINIITKNSKKIGLVAFLGLVGTWITIQAGLLDTLSPYIAFVKNYFQIGE